MGAYLDIIIIIMHYLYIICILCVTLLRHLHNTLLDNILDLPLMHDEHNLTFCKGLYNLDKRIHHLRKQ